MPKNNSPSDTPAARVRSRRTAFAYYVQACRETYETTSQGSPPPDFTKFITDCATKWKSMQEMEKRPFEELSECDKQRYNNDMQNMQQDDAPHTEKRKKPNDKPEPCRPLSAFYWFCNENRSLVAPQHPEASRGKDAVELGKSWIEASADVKEKYEAMAEKDKARYEREKKQKQD